MTVESTLIVVALAMIFDAAVGYPQVIYRTIGHPVTWIGAMIAAADRRLNQEGAPFAARRTSGAIAVVGIVAIVTAVAALIESALAGSTAGAIALAVIGSTLIAGRSLSDHVRDVAIALDKGGLAGGRAAVSKIVGRDPQTLDEAGVSRAAIESLAENASDGVVAPVFWFCVAGLPGLAAYKAINTADSMIGHRTPRHEAFGWAAARLDDLVNLPASRLTGLLFTAAALSSMKFSPRQALAAMARDAAKHRSPNAGWPEAAMAGALDLQLNGPRSYGGAVVDDAYMGDGRRDANSQDIGRALWLAGVAWLLLLLLVLILLGLAVIARG